jgi:phosphoribosylformimino-5-aminoimidazole carboxamide ribonucleotide (ProFAR) isomerase
MNVLVGDVTVNGSVTASDVAQVKGQSGQPVTAANFRSDVTASGGIVNASDIGLVKARSGTQLP